jgi:hypothetical protein
MEAFFDDSVLNLQIHKTSEISVKEFNGVMYSFQHFDFLGRIVTVMAQIVPFDNKLVQFTSLRPMPNSQAVYNAMMPTNQFFDEILHILQIAATSPEIMQGSFVRAFLIFVKAHIKKYNRIIDNDLYSYADKAIIAANSINLAFYDEFVSEEICKYLFEKMIKESIYLFSDNLYMTEYDFSNPLQPTSNLISYSDWKIINKHIF